MLAQWRHVVRDKHWLAEAPLMSMALSFMRYTNIKCSISTESPNLFIFSRGYLHHGRGGMGPLLQHIHSQETGGRIEVLSSSSPLYRLEPKPRKRCHPLLVGSSDLNQSNEGDCSQVCPEVNLIWKTARVMPRG